MFNLDWNENWRHGKIMNQSAKLKPSCFSAVLVGALYLHLMLSQQLWWFYFLDLIFSYNC